MREAEGPRTAARLVFVGLLLAFVAIVLASCRQSYEFKGTAYPDGKAAQDFTLSAADGQTFRLSQHRGQVVLLFFGYTSCPDICPTTLAEAKQVLEGLGDDAGAVRFAFITVDPERDTPEKLAGYTAFFHPDIIGLTGDPAELEQVRQAYGVVAEKEQLSESAVGYIVNHTARIFLIDPEGNLRLSYGFGTPPADILADLRHLLQSQRS